MPPTVDISHTLPANFNESNKLFMKSSLLLRENITWSNCKENLSMVLLSGPLIFLCQCTTAVIH